MLRAVSGVVVVPGCSRSDGQLTGEERVRCREALFAAMPFGDDQARERILYATQLEACAVAMANDSYAEYVRIIGRIRWNFLANGATIVSSHPVSKVCRLSHRRLHADTAHALRDKATTVRVHNSLAALKAESEKAAGIAASQGTIHVIRCPSCKKCNNIHRTIVQKNAGDEGMKTQCFCGDCKHRWQLSG
jgi:DNA-directed RNA polymerase subunit M/transcription elongation factor TFIIS